MSNPYTPPSSDLESSDLEITDDWKRSKWLSGWLWFMLISNLVNVPSTYFMADMIMAQSPKLNLALIYTLIFGSALSIAFIAMLIRYKKLGFWGIVAVAVLAFVINIYALGIKSALLGLLGLVILALLLFKGGENSAWSNYH
jgi:hypothetical protein